MITYLRRSAGALCESQKWATSVCLCVTNASWSDLPSLLKLWKFVLEWPTLFFTISVFFSGESLILKKQSHLLSKAFLFSSENENEPFRKAPFLFNRLFAQLDCTTLNIRFARGWWTTTNWPTSYPESLTTKSWWASKSKFENTCTGDFLTLLDPAFFGT